MRFTKLLILILFLILVSTLLHGETIEFYPRTLYVVSFFDIDKPCDNVCIVGKLRNGDIIGIAVAIKKYKSDDATAFNIGKNDINGIFQDYLSFDGNKCSNVNDIFKYGKSTWYKVTIDKIRPGLKKPSTKFWSVLNTPYKFESIAQASDDKLKDRKILNIDNRYESK